MRYKTEIPIMWHHTEPGLLHIWWTPDTATTGAWHCEFHTGKTGTFADGHIEQIPELSLDGFYSINGTVLHTWDSGQTREAFWDFQPLFTIRPKSWPFQVDLTLAWFKEKWIVN